LWASIEVGGVNLQVINTHLGLVARERRAQVDALLGPEWLGHPDCRDPMILVGDLNALPRSPTYRRFARRLGDAQCALRARRPRGTYPVSLPLLRIDHVFVGDAIEVLNVEVLRTPLTRIASDHLPLVVDLRLAPATHQATSAAERTSPPACSDRQGGPCAATGKP
jgi:endonuclease/exonuclease/phosphatase family metal-dependent hydrolase